MKKIIVLTYLLFLCKIGNSQTFNEFSNTYYQDYFRNSAINIIVNQNANLSGNSNSGSSIFSEAAKKERLINNAEWVLKFFNIKAYLKLINSRYDIADKFAISKGLKQYPINQIKDAMFWIYSQSVENMDLYIGKFGDGNNSSIFIAHCSPKYNEKLKEELRKFKYEYSSEVTDDGIEIVYKSPEPKKFYEFRFKPIKSSVYRIVITKLPA